MIEHAFRLTKGDDLKKAICAYCQNHNINTAIVLSAVGCLDCLNIRLAKAEKTLKLTQDFEIVALIGTISVGQAHLHIAASDENGNTLGGHLLDGSFVNTTSEIVLGELETYASQRVFDSKTGYDEIVFKEVL